MNFKILLKGIAALLCTWTSQSSKSCAAGLKASQIALSVKVQILILHVVNAYPS